MQNNDKFETPECTFRKELKGEDKCATWTQMKGNFVTNNGTTTNKNNNNDNNTNSHNIEMQSKNEEDVQNEDLFESKPTEVHHVNIRKKFLLCSFAILLFKFKLKLLLYFKSYKMKF